jgi:hypothetical protein
MDTIFIWLIAGAVIGLLGIFLVASERELKSKRRELEEIKQGLSDASSPGLSNVSTGDFPQDGNVPAELVARNKDLLEEISSLSKKLEASEGRLEQLETLRAHLNSKESEITELRWERERLQSEITTLKTPAASNEPHPDEAMQNPQTDAEVLALKQQLEISQAKIRDLESAQIPLAIPEASQHAFEEIQRSLEVSTLQLQNALAAEQEKQKALDAAQLQLAEMQQRHHELSEANMRLREENSQHQQKLANHNQLQIERLVILRQRFEELRLKQAQVSEQDRLIQDEIVSMSQLLDLPREITYAPDPFNDTHYDLHNGLEFDETNTAGTAHAEIVEPTPLGAPASELHAFHKENSGESNGTSAESQHEQTTNLTAAIAAANQGTNEFAPSGLKKKRRFGIFPAAIAALLVSGALAAGFLGRDSEPDPAAPQAKYQTTLAPSGSPTAADMKSRPAEPGRKESRSVDESAAASSVESRIAKPSERASATAIASAGKPSSTAWESYEIVQPTRVFSAPSVHSQLVANIDPGTQVNVVDSRDGWLEIRSKHGRPPGFIPKTSAIRVRQE